MTMKTTLKLKLIVRLLLAALTVTSLLSCTENSRAKSYGGTATVNLPEKTKFVTATWKDDQLWYAYRPARPGEVPETTTLKEQSKWGIVEGSVVFVEK
jgi:hypothetical protein